VEKNKADNVGDEEKLLEINKQEKAAKKEILKIDKELISE
jgi:hypothetical protein